MLLSRCDFIPNVYASQDNFFTNAYDVTPALIDQWVEVDLSSYLPSEATGCIIEATLQPGTTGDTVQIRKKGSTDNLVAAAGIRTSAHIILMSGVDSNRKIEAYIDAAADKLKLIGYFTWETFFTNYIEVTPGTTGWRDVDVSAHVPAGTTGVILDIQNVDTSNRYYAVRKKGSTDDRSTLRIHQGCHTYAVVGVDNNRQFQAYIEVVGKVRIYLVGYTGPTGVGGKLGYFTNAPGVADPPINTWTDRDANDYGVPTNATGIIVEIANPPSNAHYQGAIRENGGTDSWITYSDIEMVHHVYLACGLDADGVFEYRIEDTDVGSYIVAYFYPAAAAPVSQGMTFSDSASRTREVPRSVSQSITVSDSVGSPAEFTRSVTETLTITDLVTKLTEFFRTISQSLSLTNNLHFTKSVTQSIAISEVVAVGRVETVTGTGTLDARTYTDTEIAYRTTGSTTIALQRFCRNPVDSPTAFQSLGKNLDIKIGDPSAVTEITIKVHYTYAELIISATQRIDELSLKIYWWNGASWVACSNQGVDLSNRYVWAKITGTTTPKLSDIIGDVFTTGGTVVSIPPPPPPSPSVGGGGGGPITSVPKIILHPSTWSTSLTARDKLNLEVYADILYREVHPSQSLSWSFPFPEKTSKIIIKNLVKKDLAHLYESLDATFTVVLQNETGTFHRELTVPIHTEQVQLVKQSKLVGITAVKIENIKPSNASSFRKDALEMLVQACDDEGKVLEEKLFESDVKTSQVTYDWTATKGEIAENQSKCKWVLPYEEGVHYLTFHYSVCRYGESQPFIDDTQFLKATVYEGRVEVIPEFPNLAPLVLAVAMVMSFMVRMKVNEANLRKAKKVHAHRSRLT